MQSFEQMEVFLNSHSLCQIIMNYKCRVTISLSECETAGESEHIIMQYNQNLKAHHFYNEVCCVYVFWM